MLLRTIFVLVVALLLPACLGAPPSPLTLPAFPDRWQAITPQRVGAVHTWLKDFSDPTLHDLVQEALAYNHTIQQAALRRAAARANLGIADAARGPTAQATLDSTRARTVAGGRQTTQTTHALGASARWEPDLWGRLAASVRSSTAHVVAADADFHAAQLSLAGDVVRTWFSVVEAEQQRALATSTLASYRRTLKTLEARYQRGITAAPEVHTARMNVAQAESAQASHRQEKETRLRSLETLLGRYPRGTLSTKGRLPRWVTPVPAGLPADLLARRPDLVAAEARLTAAGARLDAARRNRLPTIQLTARSGTSSQALHDLLHWDTLVWNLVGGLVQPLFQGGGRRAEEALARIERREAWTAYAQAVLTAFRDVETALAAETRHRQQETAQTRTVREATKIVQQTRAQYRQGLVQATALLAAQRRLYAAQSTALRATRERLNNRIGLYLALGGGFQPAVQEPSP